MRRDGCVTASVFHIRLICSAAKTFWERSLFTKPADRTWCATRAAWDFDFKRRFAGQGVHSDHGRGLSCHPHERVGF